VQETAAEKRNRREKGNRPQENEDEPTKDSGRLSGFLAEGCRIYGWGTTGTRDFGAPPAFCAETASRLRRFGFKQKFGGTRKGKKNTGSL
jgi:hypothetical protein